MLGGLFAGEVPICKKRRRCEIVGITKGKQEHDLRETEPSHEVINVTFELFV